MKGWLLLLLAVAGCPRSRAASESPQRPSPQPEALLRFAGVGARAQPLSKRELEAAWPAAIIEGFDPYYQRRKRFRALPLRAVLERAFAGGELASSEFVLRATDGYSVPMRGDQLLDESAFLATADLEVEGWEPIGPRAADPAPFYLVWKGDERRDLERYPRPWGLSVIERASFESLYPHVAPPADAPPLAQRGYARFRSACIRCHAINREGGRVGPDLNVPQSIVEYRPLAQVRDYIRNPLRFRYGAMPAHPELSDVDLDGLIEYFQVMRGHKFDPAASGHTADDK